MTKKIKICLVWLTIIVILSSLLLATLLIKKSYCISINKPDSIVVYYKNSSTNIVLEKNSSSYNKIYKQLKQSYQQSMLISFVNNSLGKNPKIITHEVQQIDYADINIEFIYDAPQIIKTNGKTFKLNGEVCWYQSLVFKISKNNNFKYHSIAIIPPSDSNNYISPSHHTISCKAYSNFNDLYKTSIRLFK